MTIRPPGVIAVEQKGSGKPATKAFLVSVYIFLGLVVAGLAVSMGLFLSGMGEGLCIAFPIVLMGAVTMLLYSAVTRNRLLLFVGTAILVVIAVVWIVILLI